MPSAAISPGVAHKHLVPVDGRVGAMAGVVAELAATSEGAPTCIA